MLPLQVIMQIGLVCTRAIQIILYLKY